ncbi:hypothetical protein QDT73_06615 [Acinetobacter baumannii]|uniref:hypothetical protein n=1 Tax=Acinetobacter baumannii TaxID=470 RepID=UPI00244967D6|nr:hypothetical protein [Acinetobacter baumannii]MDH2567033.1 hypothetical protein [Acinetobacter baumannii]
MKKLFLVAILLGLMGCGDNNQSDTSQSDIQTTQLQTTNLAVPTTSNNKLVASSLMLSPAISPLGGWSITNSEVMGASTLIDAAKDTRVSAALVTPNAKQVAEVLRGGVAGVALAIAVDQLLGAVDWVLDPANSQIRFKEKPKVGEPPEGKYLWHVATSDYSQTYSYSATETCTKWAAIISKYYNNLPAPFVRLNALREIASINRADGYCITYPEGYGHEHSVYIVGTLVDINAPKEKTLSLEAVAEQIIFNADTGSLDAQVATNAATQNILNDAVQAEPVIQELENNAENRCPSGITNGNGDCWICSRESWLPIRSRVVYAKDVTNGLGGCSAGMNSSQLLTRYNAYNELGAARDAENACWSPQDQEHLIQARAAKATANDCKSYLGVLGQ